MGTYNPHAPYILGQELVPIQDLDLVFDPNANSVEYGTTFRLDTTTQLGSARFYVQGPVPQPALRQCALINVYPANIADKSGPVNQVVIPCTSVSTTGTGVVVSGANATDALYNPSDSGFVQFVYSSSLAAQYLAASFNTNSYTILGDKRILNVSLLYTGFMSDASPDDPSVSVATEFINPNAKWQSLTVLEQVDDAGRVVQFFAPSFVSNTGALTLATSLNNPPFSASAAEEFKVLSLGDVNNFWQPGVDPNIAQRTNLPWNYTDLLKFENGALTAVRQRLRVSIALPTTPGSAVFTTFPKAAFRYMALRVTYCNETRSAFGAKEFVYNIGANTVPMYDRNRNTNPILTPGDYVATLSFVDSGATDFGENLNGLFPDLNAIRELYTIPSHQSVQLNVPFPLDETVVGKTFEEETTHVLPQLTLHASGGAALLEPQVYGRQAIGQVYGSFTVTQEVHDALAGSVGTWPWIRFYARRFGHTTVPLSVAVAGGSAYITPDEFDELEQITVDNWCEVTLELSPAPSMGGGTTPQIVWSATGELAGNRWEVLGCAAPAISGLAGTLVREVPTIQRLGPATYGQPVSGSIINMAWLPQLGPYVTGTVDDNSADVSFLLSQTPPPVTGLTATWLSQAVTGIGQNCGIDPCCIPSEIYYTQLSWTPWNYDTDSIILLNDSFSRTESGSWGTPDYGPAWVSTDLSGGSIAVSGGYGLHSFSSDDSVIITEAPVDFIDGRVYAYNVAPITAPDSDFTASIYVRGADDFSYYVEAALVFLDDGTCDLLLHEEGGAGPIVGGGVPGSTNSEPIDLVLEVSGTTVSVWAALSSVGVDLSDPPTFSGALSTTASGTVYVVTTASAGLTVPNTMLYSSIIVQELVSASSTAPNVYDTFERSESGTWGTPNVGPAYNALANASALSVENGYGVISAGAGPGTSEGAVIPMVNGNSFDITVTLVNRSGTALMTGISARAVNDEISTYVEINSLSSINLVVSNSSGVIVTRAIAGTSYITTGIGSAVNMRFMISQSLVKVKIWAPGTDEPLMWSIETTATSLTSLLDYIIFVDDLSGSGSEVGVSDLQISPPRYWFGNYELQRMDTVEPTWKTIMLATNPALDTFNDFEARPGIISNYRIRQSNFYDFHGEWSPEVSGMIPTPGVDGGCLTPGHLLIFTTNEVQNGSSNLAYSSVWLDEQVEENFTFPEAGFVQMQAMYDRDFYIAFRPLERGGEQFQRTVLVQAAAIAPETLADFTSLRNMAWANVNYVCVRDEDGNRWFAHVNVPSGNVLRNRKLYLAPVQISEVTDTPTPVDPSPWF